MKIQYIQNHFSREEYEYVLCCEMFKQNVGNKQFDKTIKRIDSFFNYKNVYKSSYKLIRSVDNSFLPNGNIIVKIFGALFDESDIISFYSDMNKMSNNAFFSFGLEYDLMENEISIINIFRKDIFLPEEYKKLIDKINYFYINLYDVDISRNKEYQRQNNNIIINMKNSKEKALSLLERLK